MNSSHKPVRPATNLSLLPSNLYSFFLFLLFFNFFVKHSFKQMKIKSKKTVASSSLKHAHTIDIRKKTIIMNFILNTH